MSWPTDTERTLKLRTTSLQEHTNRLRGMHRPQEGHGPAYSIFRRDAPKPAPKPAPERPNPNRGPARGERTAQPAGPNGPNRSPKWPQRRRHPIRNRSRRPQHARFSHGRNVPPCTPNGQTAQKYKEDTEPRLKGNRNNSYGSGARYRAGWPHRPTRQPTFENQVARTPRMGRKSGDLKPRTLGRQTIPGLPGAAPHTRQPGTTGHRLDG